MQPRQLKHFLAAVDHGSMTQAAMAQNVTQPALSRSIRMLEEELGVELLERGHSGVRLTGEGRMFAEHARSILASMQTARDDIQAARTGLGGRLRIGLSEATKSARTFRAIADMALSRRDLQVTVDFDFQDSLLAKLRRNDLDAVLDYDRSDLDQGDLSFQPLHQVMLVVLARAEHPAAQGATLGELARYPWAVLDQGGAQRFFFRQLFGPQNAMPDIRLHCTAPGLLRHFARDGDFLTLQCRPVSEPIMLDEGLVEITTDLPSDTFWLSLITLRRAHATSAMKAALRDLVALLKD